MLERIGNVFQSQLGIWTKNLGEGRAGSSGVAGTRLIKASVQPYGLFKSMSRGFSGDSLEIRGPITIKRWTDDPERGEKDVFPCESEGA